MVFNTGAALLDAIVLAVVSRRRKAHMDIRSRRMWEWRLRFRNPHFIRYCVDFRKMDALWCMTENVEVATGATTGLRMREERSWTIIAENGMTILRKYQSYFPRREFEDEQR